RKRSGSPGSGRLTSGVSTPRERTPRFPMARTLTVSPSCVACGGLAVLSVSLRAASPACPTVSLFFVWGIALGALAMGLLLRKGVERGAGSGGPRFQENVARGALSHRTNEAQQNWRRS